MSDEKPEIVIQGDDIFSGSITVIIRGQEYKLRDITLSGGERLTLDFATDLYRYGPLQWAKVPGNV